jgi:hypothetical protein
MSSLGVMECNRCRLIKLQDEARKEKMVLSKRKSFYGMKPGVPGIDIYMHPRSVEIPSDYLCKHNMDMGSMAGCALFLDDTDADKWIVAWFQEIPPSCECRVAAGGMSGRKII